MAYLESVIIRANALKVDGSAVTQPVNVVSGSVAASVDLQQDVFGQLVIANRYNQFEINYDTTDPDSISEITVTKTSGGDASNLNGQAVFTSNANTNGGVKAVTNLSTTYRPNSETYAAFTAIWPSGGLANSYQRIGIYDTNNGFFIGYEGTAFGITLRKATVDTFTAQAAWNVDTLTGGVGSKYTRNGVPEAIDFTKDNLFRVRYGWLGAAPIYWEVLSPDGEWVLFDIYRHPNTTGGTTINNPDLPMTLDIQKTAAGATVLTMNTACWAAGTTSPYTKISSTINDNTLANMTRSVITGRASTGGGTYYNVKVTPSGALVTAGPEVYPEDSAHASGNEGAFVLAVRNDANTAMTDANGDYSPIAVNANGAIAINDGGNSITIDASSLPLPTGAATEATLGQVSLDVATVANSIYREDDPHTTGEKGQFVLAVRNDSNAVVTDTDGDYSQISVNSKGAVAIQDGGNSITVDGTVGVSGTVTVSGTVAATQSGTWILGANSGVDIGDVTINNGAGASAVNIQDGGNSITIDGSVTVSSGNITATTDTSYAEDSAHTTGSKGTFILAVRNDSNTDFNATDGDYTPIAVTGAGAVKIHDGGNSITVDTVAVTRTPSITRTSASGTISAGARSISVYNAGTAAGSILGVAGNILAGEAFDFSAGGQNDTLGSFAYDGTGTTLVITTIV
jgi:hypothetical protein